MIDSGRKCNFIQSFENQFLKIEICHKMLIKKPYDCCGYCVASTCQCANIDGVITKRKVHNE